MSAVVYRVYDINGALIYIGSTRDLEARKAIHMADHASPIAFAMQMCADRWDTTEYATYDDAKAAEVAAITAEAPFLNRQHNPTRWRRVAGQYVPVADLYEMAWKHRVSA